MTRVKICGITTLEDAMAAVEAGADALGFNVAEDAKKRNRYISPDNAKSIIRDLPPFVATVIITVNAPVSDLRAYTAFADLVQLHGDESPETCASIADRGIKVFRAGSTFSTEIMENYPARAYLLDAAVPGERGGTGTTCDWDAARAAVATGKPVILAGGLTPDNVADAIKHVQPFAVDTAGGVEMAPGKKDHVRIRDFIQNAKQCIS